MTKYGHPSGSISVSFKNYKNIFCTFLELKKRIPRIEKYIILVFILIQILKFEKLLYSKPSEITNIGYECLIF